MGKGSKPRPFAVDRETYESNWDRIFSKRNSLVGPTKYAILVGSGENSYYVTEDTGSCQDLKTETYSTRKEAENIADTIRSSGVGSVEVVEWLE
jgi:hypothetical protein